MSLSQNSKDLLQDSESHGRKPMEVLLRRAVIKTICYSDIFDFPLKAGEIYRFLIELKTSREELLNYLPELDSLIKQKEGYYFLPGRESIISLRKEREKAAHKKIKIAQKAIQILSKIPTIELIGITGALAMKNTPQADDIDLFFITKPNTLWTTRFLSTILAQITGKRRRPFQTNVKDYVCLNMFLDKSALKIDEYNQNIYSAHEICQLIPIFNRNQTYKLFLKENRWVKSYLPNWKPY